LGSAVGDALGAGYEFDAPPAPGQAAMIGGGLGNFAPGEWTDDTAQAVPILRAAAEGQDLRRDTALEQIARGWLDWFNGGPPDIGFHTSAVFRAVDQTAGATPMFQSIRDAANARHALIDRTAGNGALMRTGPVALAHLDDSAACAEAARLLASLTHPDPLAAEACVIWSEAVRNAVLRGTFEGLRRGVEQLPSDRWAFWSEKLDEAETGKPGSFGDNGYVVVTLQEAWSAIVTTAGYDGTSAVHFRDALDAAVCAGHDTDTVAAIAGALLGARWGASAVPPIWRQMVHGWPGLTGSDLLGLAVRAAQGGLDDSSGWPTAASLVDYYSKHWHVRPEPIPHPEDEGLWLGSSGTLRLMRPGGPYASAFDVVVSLCRVGRDDVPPGIERVEVWLVDSPDAGANPNLTWVMDYTVAWIRELRAKGKRVLVHCVAGASRTPTVGALYGAAVTGLTPLEELERIRAAAPHTSPNAAFMALLTDRSWRPQH
jgi:ADP-ribosyl-[dinitrogen reductase] hydrolase